MQRLGDLRAGRRSTAKRIAESVVEPTMPSATPGDLSFVLPYRHLVDILDFLDAMDTLAPGAAADGTLLYGIEGKFYSSRLELDATLNAGEITVPGEAPVSGTNLDVQRTVPQLKGDEPAVLVNLDAAIGAGDLEVRRAAA